MKILDKIDNFLHRIFTFNSRYPKLEERPQFSIAMTSTLVLLFLIYILNYSILAVIAITLLFISSYYQWRLWFRLRK